MKTKHILFALLIVLSAAFVSCEKETIPVKTVTIDAYGEGSFIAGLRLSSWDDGVWQKSTYTDNATIVLPDIEVPDTLTVGTWGNRLIVYIDEVCYLDTAFTPSYVEFVIPVLDD